MMSRWGAVIPVFLFTLLLTGTEGVLGATFQEAGPEAGQASERTPVLGAADY